MNTEKTMETFRRLRPGLLDDLFEFLRFPTVSARPEHKPDMARCAAWVRDRLAAAGMNARVVETGGHPAVLADSGPPASPAAPALLVYGHYDVQPVGREDLWHSRPFEPVVRDGAVYARGSADDKGQLMIHLAVAKVLREAGLPWPVRLRFLVEGEEEIGSPSLPGLLRDLKAELACDYVLISDTSRHDAHTPALTCGTRGLVYKEIIVTGPSRDLHSGQFGGTVANPANVLAAIVAGLHDGEGRVAVPGFYDDVAPVHESDNWFGGLAEVTDEQLQQATGSPRPSGEPGFTTAQRRSIRPTLDVNGLLSGYTGQGAATIIPAQASAKISMRLVPHQDPQRVSEAFDGAVRALCPDTVRLQIVTHQGCRAYRLPPGLSVLSLAAEALEFAYGRKPVMSLEGGTLPILPLFKEVLGADSLMLGFADPNCNLHSPDEFFHLADFDRGVACISRFLLCLGSRTTIDGRR